MPSKTKSKGKSQRPHSTFHSRSTKPRITLERISRSEPSVRDKALKRLHLKPSDIFSEATRGGHLVFVTKNGMKIRVPK